MGGFFGVCLTAIWFKAKSGFASLVPKPKDKKQNVTLFSSITSCRRCGSSGILSDRTKGLYRCEHCFFLDHLFVDLATGKPVNFPERGFE
jgi:hypothetical protein